MFSIKNLICLFPFNSYKASLTLFIEYSTAFVDGGVSTYAGKMWVPGKTKNIFRALQAIVIVMIGNGHCFMWP